MVDLPQDIALRVKKHEAALLPTGGNAMRVLAKQTNADYDAGWQDIAGLVAAAGFSTGTPPSVTPSAVTFSYPGALDNDVESPPFYAPKATTYHNIRVNLLNAASINHVIALRRNGSTFAQYTLTAGSKTVKTTGIAFVVTTTQPITIATRTVADTNLSVQLYEST